MCCASPNVRTLGTLSLLTAFAALCLAALLPDRAQAGAYTYGSGTQRTVNAGVLLLNDALNANKDSTGTTGNKDPYVFYILNQRTDIRPFGWNIVNPFAPKTVTPEIQARWDARTGGSRVYTLGQTVTPSMAAYWEVPLGVATSSDNLAQFDVLFLNLTQSGVEFTALDVEKLRRFVDGGGTLWIEFNGSSGAGGVISAADPLFFNLDFSTAPASGLPFLGPLGRTPLINTPYQLSEGEIGRLGDKGFGTYSATITSPLVTVVGANDAAHPVIAAGQLGAGQIVVTCTGTADAINEYVTGGAAPPVVPANSGPFCGINFQNAPTQDLKLMANILASTSTHQNEHQNTRQTGNDPSALSSAVKTWTAPNNPPAGGNANGSPSNGVAIYGHIAFATDSLGVLYAYDIYPAEDLDGDGDPDDGAKNGTTNLFPDFDQGQPYDEIWQTPTGLGAGASAPTVAVDPATSAVYVLVEDAGGAVYSYPINLKTLALPAAVKLKNSGGGALSYGAATAPGPAPAPTYYDGRVYSGDASGELYVYTGYLDGTNAAATKFLLNPVMPSVNTHPEYVSAPPTVGIVPDGNGGNDIVALCTTNEAMYSVILGARGEILKSVGGNNYNAQIAALTNARMDIATFLPRAYTAPSPGLPASQAVTFSATVSEFQGYSGPDTLFGDYNTELVASQAVSNNGPLTRTLVAFASSNATATLNTTNVNAYVSAPALDRSGNAYFTVTDKTSGNSSLYCVSDAPTAAKTVIKWRFRLPKTGESPGIDAEGASYDALEDFKFVTTNTNGSVVHASAPVVDGLGHVYVLASKPTAGGVAAQAAVLCINGTADVTADVLALGDSSAVNGLSVSQPIGGGDGPDEFGNSPASTISLNSQFTTDFKAADLKNGILASGGGHLDFFNFGVEQNGTGGTHQLFPNMNEPFPISVSYSVGSGDAQTSQTSQLKPLHTNVAWYTVLSVNATSGVTLVGNTLYFLGAQTSGPMTTDGLYSVPADPQIEGFTISNKFIDATKNGSSGQVLLTNHGDPGVGDTTAAPASAGGALLVGGPKGLTAYTNQITLVVDANRILEIDSSGNAQWAVDSTTRTTVVNNAGANPVFASTTLELNRPSSVYELAQNDYLVADTGNNRCVRFDRAGKVLWELTKFTDPNNRMAPGEPDTLNQPTGVQVQSDYDQASGNTTLRYLVSDTGNNRIVEIDDIYDKNFVLKPSHVLGWISHTHDRQGRDYRYQSASYYTAPPVAPATVGLNYVLALVTNKRIAPLLPRTTTLGSLAPANQDALGGSIVLLDYDPTKSNTGTQADGYIATHIDSNTGAHSLISVSSFQANLTASGGFDLTAATNQAGTTTTLLIRNPRYLKVFTNIDQVPGGGTQVVRHYMLADDNGAFDIGPTLNGPLRARWGYTQADYQAMTTPIDQAGVNAAMDFKRDGIAVPLVPPVPFVPTSVQRTGTETVNLNGTSYIMGRYLITNGYSQGEAANNIGTPTGTYVQPGFGGEVFEVHPVLNGATLQSVEINDTVTGSPRYLGHTISRPGSNNTSPLSQPTFGFRLQF